MNGLVFALLRRLVPSTALRNFTVQELEEFSVRHQQLDKLGVALFLLFFWPLATVALTAILLLLGELRDNMMPPHIMLIRLRPDWLRWALPGMFLGIISAGWLLSVGYRIYFGTEFCRLMQAAGDHKAKMDMAKAFRWMSIGTVTLSLAWVVIELEWYTRLEADKIVINSFCGFGEKAYSYKRVTDLVEPTHLVAPNGKLVERTHQYVVFDDGESWCHDGMLRNPQPLIELLEGKTGKKFRRVRFYDVGQPVQK